MKGYYNENRVKIAERKRKHREKRHQYIQDILVEHGCIGCGTHDLRVLEFHHPNGKEKYYVGQMLTLSRARLDKEVAECEILCANCHKIEHYELDKKGGE